jgi:hypothetical protein
MSIGPRKIVVRNLPEIPDADGSAGAEDSPEEKRCGWTGELPERSGNE